MSVIACPHCRAFHVLFNGPPRTFTCVDCGGWMEETSLDEAHAAYQRAATVTAEEP